MPTPGASDHPLAGGLLRPQLNAPDPPGYGEIGHSLLRRLANLLDVQGSHGERVVRAVAAEISNDLGASLAQLYVVDPTGELLLHSGSWEVDPDDRRRTSGGPDARPLRRGQGLPGSAWVERQTVWVRDLGARSGSSEGDPRYCPPDVRTAVAFPIVSEGSVFGVLEFWFVVHSRADPQKLEEIELALRILGESLARQRAEERLSEAADRSLVAILARGDEGALRIVFSNSAFGRVTGFSPRELRGRGLDVLMGTDTEPGTAQRIETLLDRSERVTTEFLAYRKDGTAFLLRLDIMPVVDERGIATHFVALDPESSEGVGSAQVKRVDQDPLTGLVNRALLNESLRRAVERARKRRDYSFAVLFVDLDGFKAVNDSFGHMLGDQLLVAVARQLEGAVRPGDIVARYGGDEFVVLLDMLGGLQPVLAVADRILDRLSRPLRLPGRDVTIGTSIGIALSDSGQRTVEDILTEADAAMYLAKQAGGGRYRIFDLALQEAAIATQRIRAGLIRSLERGEFKLHYQPMVELASDGIAGLEALLRWDHPERGVLPAREFIAEAEEMGLILPIGRWVIREACRQLRVWRDELPAAPLVLSVNLSTRELADPGLADWLKQSLVQTGADPRCLRLEIPEDFFARPRSEARAALRPLLDLGVRIAIGDFGSGYASLGMLPRLPVDCLKIDRKFVADFPLDDEPGKGADNTRVVRSILALAESLGIPVSASGVETLRQREMLGRLACRYAQGNYFSEPVDAAGAAQLLRRAWGEGPTAQPH